MKKTKVLFVCTGNICRSPLAHKMFEKIVDEGGAEDKFEVDSCGIGAWHEGENADARMRATASRHGLNFSKKARGFRRGDLVDFDHIICMDMGHVHFLRSQARNEKMEDAQAKIQLMRDFDIDTSDGKDVPDPYYGGDAGFEFVYEVVKRSCENFFSTLHT